ncbi:MAG: phage antirepressor protein [Candidatus Levybacteria bacterium RIFCSPHIGHO2_12_FULL_38_12]|nr:MAG: phage antirepressor protein [Candidatus Levybacteria bacterium RIFCSPHIGHO2_01_FULL_38_12]OGH22726.1 MAG: phage antirepressor protein [Candidatus Levybacteria bacterium RIFCSPHIGHO2_12_FULL_38_12]OGH44866.1 MAG: phage antirepressor protein [Candidatus Levybacteria bacterium RIFCSPLOWO2_02_FULL_37_18]
MVDTKIAIFKGKEIRKTIYNNEWWFSVIDVVKVLTGTDRQRKYWNDLKVKLVKEGYVELSEKIGQLKLESSDGKKYLTDCASTETIFRIIQAIPSPKAEPLKRWLARIGYERIREIEDPELATKRTRALYKAKGYPDDWVEKRMRGIAIREELTDEWDKRGAKMQKDYEILTAEISKATFGVTPSQYKKLKSLKRENLRDHMDDFELIFTMLGERATTEIHRNENSKGVPKLRSDAKAGGDIAGGARKKLEKRLKRSIVSRENYLPKKRKVKQLT